MVAIQKQPDFSKRIRINANIRSPEVRVVGPNSEQLGVLPIGRALEVATEHNLDLVEVAPTASPPVCRIMNFSKYKYDQEKKERRVRHSQKVTHLKQLRVKPHIDEHDYQTKLKQAVAFLHKKDKVKINLFFRGREMAFMELGKRILDKFMVDLEPHGQIERPPETLGRVVSVVIAPKAGK